MPLTMSATDFFRTPSVKRTVQLNDPMITDITPATLLCVPAFYLRSFHVSPFRCVRAVDNNLFNLPHIPHHSLSSTYLLVTNSFRIFYHLLSGCRRPHKTIQLTYV